MGWATPKRRRRYRALVWHTAPKLARIESIEPHFSSGQLQFLDSWNQDYPELIEQLVHFPLASHDDGPDALAGAVALIIEYSQKRDKILYPRAR